MGIIRVVPMGKFLQSILRIINGNIQKVRDFQFQFYIGLMILLVLLFIGVWCLRRIAKKQIRVPLFFNYAINGAERRIVIEKVKPGECPICGGKMKYYNRPVEWREYYVDGKRKREVVKRTPALECRRNDEHWFKVDPAGDRVS